MQSITKLSILPKFIKNTVLRCLKNGGTEIDLGFCLNCNFYSDKLEICISCELKQRNSALHYKPGLQETQLQFNYDGLATLPMRWQCEECEKKASGKLDAPIFRKFEAGKKERRTDSWMQSSEKQIRETTG
ncbi:hypothetical protein L5515_011180 [Caenorhabditis briggsae]|uniref:Uncharacterized protein n=1 Tax=Caenorhabditis briggsae TaxID=6238 RepID=A0AAE9JG21_CAEBR|nr:hypothetical protein L5515_011180 [Caenorhabditis briggsae]